MVNDQTQNRSFFYVVKNVCKNINEDLSEKILTSLTEQKKNYKTDQQLRVIHILL